MIFVAVRQNDCANVLAILFQIRDVWNDQIDAQQLGLREHHAGIDHDEVVAVAKRHHVHAELTETTEGNCEKRLQRLAQRNVISSVCMARVSQWAALAGIATPAPSDQKKTRTCGQVCYGHELPPKRCAIAERTNGPRGGDAR